MTTEEIIKMILEEDDLLALCKEEPKGNELLALCKEGEPATANDNIKVM